MKQNILFTVKNQMCTGCGICEDVCPKNCINIQRMNGENRPTINEQNCVNCQKCLKVCPGTGINFNDFIRLAPFSDKYIGNYFGLHTGYSLDEEVRYHSSSGGMVSQFLIYLLEKKIIDGAVVTAYGADHITPISYIARNREDVVRARSSKYCPVSLNKVGNEIAKQKFGKYIIVGTPCHIQGFRKRMAVDKRLKERVLGLFSIFCSSGRNFNAQDFLFKHYGVNKENIEYFAYRDNGCLGNLTIRENISSEKQRRVLSVPFIQYYGSLLRSFFKPHRCLTCIDHYGELADVSFGDIHIKPYSDDTIGISSWITRTEFWENLFCNAANDGYIKMENVDAQTLNKSQAAMLFPKKRRARVAMRMDSLMGKAIPQYDRALEKPLVKDYISEIICQLQRFVGRHKRFWWIIEMLKKGT